MNAREKLLELLPRVLNGVAGKWIGGDDGLDNLMTEHSLRFEISFRNLKFFLFHSLEKPLDQHLLIECQFGNAPVKIRQAEILLALNFSRVGYCPPFFGVDFKTRKAILLLKIDLLSCDSAQIESVLNECAVIVKNSGLRSTVKSDTKAGSSGAQGVGNGT